MKRLFKLAFIATLAMGVASCGSTGEAEQNNNAAHSDHDGHDHETESKEEAVSGSFSVDSKNSEVLWTGGVLKIGGEHMYSHSGTITISDGKMAIENGNLTAGKIIIDMTSIVPTDDNYGGEGHTAKDLVGHLSSADFFNVSEFPEAHFVFNTVREDKPITGEMTIRGISHEETLENVTISTTDGIVLIQGAMTIDRQKYDVAYDMGAEDKLISDDIDLTFKIASPTAL